MTPEDARTAIEAAYDDRIARLKTALRMGMPAEMAIGEDTRLSVAMDELRERHREAINSALGYISADIDVESKQLQGAIEALRLLWDDIRETDKRFIPNDVRAKVDAALGVK